jgi:hypothetical protein
MKKFISVATASMFLLSTAGVALAQSTQSGGMGNSETGSQQKITPPQSQPQGGPLMGTGGGSGSSTTGGTSSGSGTSSSGGSSGTTSTGTSPSR